MQPKLSRKIPMKRSRNRLLIPLACLLALAILAAGTLTYSNLTQSATNRMSGFVNHGARLHDDYKYELGKLSNDKDIYVENYGDTPLMVRVRLDEFLQINGLVDIGESDAVFNDPRWGWETFKGPLKDTLGVDTKHGTKPFSRPLPLS